MRMRMRACTQRTDAHVARMHVLHAWLCMHSKLRSVVPSPRTPFPILSPTLSQWQDDDTWYSCDVVSFNSDAMTHLVRYLDDDVEEVIRHTHRHTHKHDR